ncbi:alpha/beta fold hydrolase [Arthrobacter sp. I3]|uniref:alpha/beta fold hydrolase n=1 Tax=Arthrobacter sp. I3 TaxID=218158 RepID=UPI0031B7F343
MAERILRGNVGDIAVLGTSMGGYVALEVIRQAPDRVTALALVSTSARADSAEQLQARARQSVLVEGGHFEKRCPRPGSPSSRVPATSCSTSSPPPHGTPLAPGLSPPHNQPSVKPSPARKSDSRQEHVFLAAIAFGLKQIRN